MLDFLTGNWFFFFVGVILGFFLGNKSFRERVFTMINGLTHKKEEPPQYKYLPPQETTKKPRRRIVVDGRVYYSDDDENVPPQER